jgi:undecaprenyl diphosphate synthase
MTDPGPNAVEPDRLADVPPEDRPKHIAIIMDGNGRWAKTRGLPRIEGHRRGVNTVRMISETATEIGIAAVNLY